MSALDAAALAAEAEAVALLDAAGLALALECEADVLYDAATDAIEAYDRARARAVAARKLADHAAGAYNAFGDAA